MASCTLTNSANSAAGVSRGSAKEIVSAIYSVDVTNAGQGTVTSVTGLDDNEAIVLEVKINTAGAAKPSQTPGRIGFLKTTVTYAGIGTAAGPGYECAYWHKEDGGVGEFRTDGVKSELLPGGKVRCNTTHLTEFAVLRAATVRSFYNY